VIARQRALKQTPLVWLGQSVDTSSICSAFADFDRSAFLTSLGCAIRKPSLRTSCFNGDLRSKIGVHGPLMIDSGGFALSSRPDPKWDCDIVFGLYSNIPGDIYVSLDYPPMLDDGPDIRKQKIIASNNNYQKLSSLLAEKLVMPVVHGRTMSEIDLSLNLLLKSKICPTWVGLGGLVPLLKNRRLTAQITGMGAEVFIAKALRKVRAAFPKARIHAFGAGGTVTFPAVFSFGADSADSIGWRQAAGFGSVFLPLKTQRIVTWAGERPPRKLMDASDLRDLANCQCPICRRSASVKGRLRSMKGHFQNRAIHNAWTITRLAVPRDKTRAQVRSFLALGGLGKGWANAAKVVAKNSASERKGRPFFVAP
jgi:queuine/archaeosine tRNA-ribosyltransferase